VTISTNVAATADGFARHPLARPLLDALAAAKFVTPTPIQAQAIPILLEGRDIIGIAQTGTGKTAAFALPLLNRLHADPRRPEPKRPRIVVLSPTRELAIQIGETFKTLASRMKISLALVFGGVSDKGQIALAARGVDVMVATPGRLLDLVERGHVSFAGVEGFVLDEADRMLDMGFVRDVKKLVRALPAKRQSLMFSATMPPAIREIAAQMLKDPAEISVTPEVVTVEAIAQSVRHVPAAGKKAELLALLEDPAMRRVIVFCRTKHGANKVAAHLDEAGVGAVAIHGNKSQNARQAALNAFKSGNARVLVATDIAARGIDVPGVSHVINYELPNEPESYVHRIGRTARAGREGIAVALCDPSERAYLRDIERLTGVKLTVVGAGPQGPETSPPPQGRSARPARQGGRPAPSGRQDARQESRQPRREQGGKPRHAGERAPAERTDSRPTQARPTQAQPAHAQSNRRGADQQRRPAAAGARSDRIDTGMAMMRPSQRGGRS
jgi:ATP-dependent RNA helicase RhlE